MTDNKQTDVVRETFNKIFHNKVILLPKDEPKTESETELCYTCLGATYTCFNCGRPESQCTCVELVGQGDWKSGYDPVKCVGCGGTGKEVRE